MAKWKITWKRRIYTCKWSFLLYYYILLSNRVLANGLKGNVQNGWMKMKKIKNDHYIQLIVYIFKLSIIKYI